MTDSLYRGTGGHNYIQDEDNDVITHQNHIEESIKKLVQKYVPSLTGQAHLLTKIKAEMKAHGDQRAEEGAKAERERCFSIVQKRVDKNDVSTDPLVVGELSYVQVEIMKAEIMKALPPHLTQQSMANKNHIEEKVIGEIRIKMDGSCHCKGCKEENNNIGRSCTIRKALTTYGDQRAEEERERIMNIATAIVSPMEFMTLVVATTPPKTTENERD